MRRGQEVWFNGSWEGLAKLHQTLSPAQNPSNGVSATHPPAKRVLKNYLVLTSIYLTHNIFINGSLPVELCFAQVHLMKKQKVSNLTLCCDSAFTAQLSIAAWTLTWTILFTDGQNGPTMR